MLIEETRQKVKDYHEKHNALLKQIEQAKLAKNETQIKQLNREFSLLVKKRQYVYRGWALEEALEAVADIVKNKLSHDDLVKQLQENINIITSTTEKEKFINEFFSYVFPNDDDTKASLMLKITI